MPRIRLLNLRRDLGEARVSGPDGALVRGAHWRNFLAKYSESNRMHKKMQALSALCRRRGNPAEARRAIGRAQCNDAYWHGVFGGLYLPHLRDAIWRELARAEGELRRGKGLAWEVLDFDADGHPEIWVHSESFSALVSPARGASVEEYTFFAAGINYANVLTRRREAYHDLALERAAAAAEPGRRWNRQHPRYRGRHPPGCAASDRPGGSRPAGRAPAARLAGPGAVCDGRLSPSAFLGRRGISLRGTAETGRARDRLCSGGGVRLAKLIRFGSDGELTVSYAWDPGAAPEEVFTTELSLAAQLTLAPTPDADIWRHPIETVAKSERGLDRTRQGESVTLRWPARLGEASLRLRPA